jgi:HAD superfamily hydrolase (TIGR01490 family)
VRRPRAEEVNVVHEVKEKDRGVAAFFDLDGTLVALPSLERRFFRALRRRKLILLKNYLCWLMEAIRLMPHGISAILQANKMYLRGVHILDERGEGDGGVSSWHKDGHQAEGQASAPPRRNPRWPVSTFFAKAIETVARHAKQGHEIVVLSGTLEPLAREAARALEAALAARGTKMKIRVVATRLEELEGRWTGQVLGAAMFGEEKARAAKRLAAEMGLDLGRCYAYGDSWNDRFLMAVVGRPAAVNPSKDVASIARTRGWPILNWEENQNITERRRAHRGITGKKNQRRRFRHTNGRTGDHE